MNKIILLIFLSFILCLNGEELAVQIDSRLAPNDILSKNTMEFFDERTKKKTKHIELISKSMEDSKYQMIWFLKPADDKGVSFLKIEKDNEDDIMQMWLPRSKKLRRIKSSDKSDSFMGSDLSFEDLTNRNINEYIYNLKIDLIDCSYNEKLFQCYELESIPNISSEYSRHITKVLEIEKNLYLAIYEESFDNEGKLLKTKHITYEKINNFYIMNSLEVTNVQEKHKTILSVGQIKLDNNFKSNEFQDRFLRRMPKLSF